MSREYVSGIVVGFEFNHNELLAFMKKTNSEIWTEDYFESNKGCNAMIAEDFADEYGFVAKQDNSLNKEHVIGVEMENGLNHKEFSTCAEAAILKIKQTLALDKEPEIYSTLITY
jgi:hypothetical protein